MPAKRQTVLDRDDPQPAVTAQAAVRVRCVIVRGRDPSFAAGRQPPACRQSTGCPQKRSLCVALLPRVQTPTSRTAIEPGSTQATCSNPQGNCSSSLVTFELCSLQECFHFAGRQGGPSLHNPAKQSIRLHSCAGQISLAQSQSVGLIAASPQHREFHAVLQPHMGPTYDDQIVLIRRGGLPGSPSV